MKPVITLRKALSDQELLGNALPGPSWQVWRILLIAAMGEKLTKAERKIFHQVTGRQAEPGRPVRELWAVVGRRGGKTRAAGTLAAYIACLCDHSASLAPGEHGVLPILAASTTQATRAFQAVLGVITQSPVLSAELKGEPTSEVIRLKSDIDIEIRPANFRTIRGVTAIAAVGDETAFWAIEGSTNPDHEILNALRPSLGTTGGPLIVISSPYAKKGALYRAYRRYWGVEGDVLVAKGPSRTFNPTLPQSVVDAAYAEDAAAAASEYGGEFRSDVEAFITLEAVEACVPAGLTARAPLCDVAYVGCCDPSGGSTDSMTMAIAHREGDIAVLDYIGERKPPFSPDEVCTEFAAVFRNYGIDTIFGDRYAGEWPRERFRVHGVEYVPAEQSRSEAYLTFLPLLNSRRLRLLDHQRMVSQFVGLERRVGRTGRDAVDHGPGAHDDIANSIALAIVNAMKDRSVGELVFSSVETNFRYP